MNGEDLKEALQELLDEHDVSHSDLAYEEYEETFADELRLQLGDFEVVQSATRTEGGGDYDGAQAVYHFKGHDVYISIEGWYGSEAGYNFDEGLDVVEPKQVTNTIYVSKK